MDWELLLLLGDKKILRAGVFMERRASEFGKGARSKVFTSEHS